MNPNLDKGVWSPEEDLKLMSLIVEKGHKWALISRQFNGIRNEHSIKNHYNKLIKRILGVEPCSVKENKEVDKALLGILVEFNSQRNGS